jgi:hypothetical protein
MIFVAYPCWQFMGDVAAAVAAAAKCLLANHSAPMTNIRFDTVSTHKRFAL